MPAMRLDPAPIATRVVRARLGRWDAWAMEPGGVWVWSGKAWTRRGAHRRLRELLYGDYGPVGNRVARWFDLMD